MDEQGAEAHPDCRDPSRADGPAQPKGGIADRRCPSVDSPRIAGFAAAVSGARVAQAQRPVPGEREILGPAPERTVGADLLPAERRTQQHGRIRRAFGCRRVQRAERHLLTDREVEGDWGGQIAFPGGDEIHLRLIGIPGPGLESGRRSLDPLPSRAARGSVKLEIASCGRCPPTSNPERRRTPCVPLTR